MSSRAHVLAGWRQTHTNIVLFWLPSQDSPVMATGPRYIALARTAQKTSLPKVTPLLHVTQPLPSNDRSLAPQFLL
jgi:hypothetical protein